MSTMQGRGDWLIKSGVAEVVPLADVIVARFCTRATEEDVLVERMEEAE